MRILPLVLALVPSFAFATDIPLYSDVTAVTLYPSGATITREVPFSTPAGQHDLILTDLPRSTPLESVRVAVDGAVMGSVTVRYDFVPPRDEGTDAAIEAAEAEVERLEQAMRDGIAGVERIRLEQDAAGARVDFLTRIGEGEGVAQMDVTALRELVGMIGNETLAAKQAAHEARLRASKAERDLQDTREDLEKAHKALRALVPEVKARAMLAISVSSGAAAEGLVTVTYNISPASWQPVYDVKLDRSAAQLEFQRGALVAQSTGENWQDVALTLSTVRPSEQTAPSQIWPWQRWVEDPVKVKQMARALDSSGVGMLAEPAFAPMVLAEETASVSFDGLVATYYYPKTISVASGADHVRIALGDLSTSADLVAQAVPMLDETAFLMARITNDMGELILPGIAMFYLDGRYIGQNGLDLIPAGGKADLSFGPIDGLRLTRTVLDRNQGDRGILSKSNELTEAVLIEVENLTAEAWPIRLLDRVPYSEQEDLEITWRARPQPTEQDVDGLRGILVWEFDLPAGDTGKIELNQVLEWPEGQILR